MNPSKNFVLIALSVMAYVAYPQQTTDANKQEKTLQESNGKTSFWDILWNFFLPHTETRKILYEKETHYFYVTVEEDSARLRHLVFNPNKGSQSIWNPSRPDELVSNSCKYTAIFPALTEKPPQKVLFIGLGAGIMPRLVRKIYPESQIDIVEIDPDIPPIAEKYFNFKKYPNMNIIIKDGRDFLNRNKKKYDIIFIDAYNASSVPFHLSTREFFEQAKNALVSDGFLSANIADVGMKNFAASEIKTIKDVFPNIIVFSPGNKMTYIIFARQTGSFSIEEIKKKSMILDANNLISCKLSEIAETAMNDENLDALLKNGIILTDDFAPVELMK